MARMKQNDEQQEEQKSPRIIKSKGLLKKSKDPQESPVWTFASTIRIHPFIEKYWRQAQKKKNTDFLNANKLSEGTRKELDKKAEIIADAIWEELQNKPAYNKWKWIYQIEVGKETGKYHLQCFLRTTDKKRRPKQLAKELATRYMHFTGIVVQAAHDPEALKYYCMKDDSKVGEKQWNDQQQQAGVGSVYKDKYMGHELKKVFDEPRPWQHWLNKLIESEPDDRTIYWICEEDGNVGKSIACKAHCFFDKSCCRIPVGTANQLKSYACGMEQRRTYFIDVPRSLGNQSNMRDVFEAIEEIKNGWVCCAMYGKVQELFMKNPHVICFANFLPEQGLQSFDRWSLKAITSDFEIEDTEFPIGEQMNVVPGQNKEDIRNYYNYDQSNGLQDCTLEKAIAERISKLPTGKLQAMIDKAKAETNLKKRKRVYRQRYIEVDDDE